MKHRDHLAGIGRVALKLADRAFDGVRDVPSQSDKAVLRSLESQAEEILHLVREAQENLDLVKMAQEALDLLEAQEDLG